MIECEHGDPKPSRCALCRRREDELLHPERYEAERQRRERAEARTTPVPKPVWFDLEVERARENARTR